MNSDMKKKYKESMSQFSVSEDLIRRTARKMERQLDKPKQKKVLVLNRRVMTLAAAVCVLVISAGVFYTYQAGLGDHGLLQSAEKGNALPPSGTLSNVYSESGESQEAQSQQSATENNSTLLAAPGPQSETGDSKGSADQPVSGAESGNPASDASVEDASSAAEDKSAIDSVSPFAALGATERVETVKGLKKISLFKLSGSDYSGLKAKSVEAVVMKSNPWKADSTPSTLPVYRNTLNASGYLTGASVLSIDQMKEIAEDTAKKFGLAPETAKRPLEEQFEKEGRPEKDDSEKYPQYTLEFAENCKITALRNGVVNVEFLNPQEAPKELLTGTETEKKDRIAKNFYETKLAAVLGFKTPAFDARVTYTADNGNPDYYPVVYDAEGDLAQQMFNYSFCAAQINVTCLPADEKAGQKEAKYVIPSVTFRAQYTGEKLGDYPVIGVDEAKTLLYSGYYESLFPFETELSDKTVKDVQLVYMTNENRRSLAAEKDAFTYNGAFAYDQPVYRFLVEVTEPSQETIEQSGKSYTAVAGLKTYAEYYVPAVRGEYIQKNVK